MEKERERERERERDRERERQRERQRETERESDGPVKNNETSFVSKMLLIALMTFFCCACA